jgi:hypothetical protein
MKGFLFYYTAYPAGYRAGNFSQGMLMQCAVLTLQGLRSIPYNEVCFVMMQRRTGDTEATIVVICFEGVC